LVGVVLDYMDIFQFLNLYPVLNKYTQMKKRTTTIPKMSKKECHTEMSLTPKNPYLKPSTIYKMGLNLATCPQKEGSILIE
jgi:hypothetical protein